MASPKAYRRRAFSEAAYTLALLRIFRVFRFVENDCAVLSSDSLSSGPEEWDRLSRLSKQYVVNAVGAQTCSLSIVAFSASVSFLESRVTEASEVSRDAIFASSAALEDELDDEALRKVSSCAFRPLFSDNRTFSRSDGLIGNF